MEIRKTLLRWLLWKFGSSSTIHFVCCSWLFAEKFGNIKLEDFKFLHFHASRSFRVIINCVVNCSNVGAFPCYSQEVSEKEQDLTYQLRVTLFDRKHQLFFGKTWKSQPQRMKNNKTPFNEVALLYQAFPWNKTTWLWFTVLAFLWHYFKLLMLFW